MNIQALVIPVVLGCIGIEYILSRKLKDTAFDYRKTIANLSVGAAERLLNIWCSGMFYFVFEYIYAHYRLFNVPQHWYMWILLLMLADFLWYWYHRFGHEINILWAFHIVHHQSEDFNYSTSTRVTIFQALIRNIFWCVMPFIGFTPVMVMAILVVHGAYSFFTHTEMVGKLGWIEKIFITPSHHRVHHACNEAYLDKNYGDVFVFWDKLFGTFKEEDEKPVYGLTTPLRSYSFLWQHFHYLLEMIYRIKHTSGFLNKFRIVLGRPDVMKGDERSHLEPIWLVAKTSVLNVHVLGRYRRYIDVQIVAVMTGLFLITLFSKQITALDGVFSSIFILLTLINCCALLEQRRWIFFVEYLRIMVLLVALSVYLGNVYSIIIFNAIAFLVTIEYNTLKRRYIRLVYR